MHTEQFELFLAYIRIIAQNTAVIAAQGQLQRPLTDEEYGQIDADVQQAADLLQSGLDVGVLLPGVGRLPA